MNIKVNIKLSMITRSKKKKTATDHSFAIVPLWWKQSEIGLSLTEPWQGTRNAAQKNLLGAQQSEV